MGLNIWARKFAKGVTLATLATTGSFALWTRKCRWPDIDEETDSILTSKYFSRYNPFRNPSLIDNCTRRIELSQLPQELVQDLEHGGTKLIERFSAAIWGSFGEPQSYFLLHLPLKTHHIIFQDHQTCLLSSAGYTPQRRVWGTLFRDLPGRETQLWEPKDLLASTYEVGTVVTDHLKVIEKSSRSLLFRAGHSARTLTEEPCDKDSMVEVTIDPNFEAGYADLGIKTVMYQGAPKSESKEKPLQGIQRLHMWYTEILMESAILLLKVEDSNGES